MFRDLVEVCFILSSSVAQGESCGDCAKHAKHPYTAAEGDRLCSHCGNINCNMLKPLQLHMLHHLQLSLLAVAYAKSTRIVLAFDSEICDQSQAEFLRFCPIECNLARHVTFKLMGGGNGNLFVSNAISLHA